MLGRFHFNNFGVLNIFYVFFVTETMQTSGCISYTGRQYHCLYSQLDSVISLKSALNNKLRCTTISR